MSKEIEWKKSSLDYDRLNELTHQRLAAAEWSKLNLTGHKHTEETRKKWSEVHTGKKMNKEHADKLHQGRKDNAWERILNRIPKEDILNAIEIHMNHQSNIISHLDTNYHTYKKLCNHYGIIRPKQSLKDKTEFAVKNQSTPVLVWYSNNGERGEFYEEFYSVSECCRVMGLHKGHMLNSIKNNVPHKGYFFQKKFG